jgi:hypothetical protein
MKSFLELMPGDLNEVISELRTALSEVLTELMTGEP